jgi:6-phosphogluconolactonase
MSVRKLLVRITAVAAVSLAALQAAEFVYVANNVSNDVSGFSVGATGALVPIGTVPAGSGPISVAVDPGGKFVYVANQNSNTISAYIIGATGVLTPVSGSPFAAGASPDSLAVDPTGRFLYVANFSFFSPGTVSGFSINRATGALTPISGSPFPNFFFPVSLAVDPTGKFLYVVNAKQSGVPLPGGVFAYTINASTGALTPISGPSLGLFDAGFKPVSLAVDPTGQFVYVVDEALNPFPPIGQGVVEFTINPTTGALAPIAGSPLLTVDTPRSVAVDPTGKFVYVANHEGTVSAFSIGATGALTAIGSVAAGGPVAVGFSPSSVAVDPTGRFVYVVNPDANAIFAFGIGPTGALTPLGSVPAGTRPISVAIATNACRIPPVISAVSANPAVLWPPNHNMTAVSVNYNLTAQCGTAACTLSVASNEPTGADPDWVVIDPHHVELRADRTGGGSGRIYTINIACTDTAGNSARSTTTVTVPHDQAH